MQTLIAKYWLPHSLTWWTGIIMLLSGVALALAPIIPALSALSGPLSAIWGGQDAALLIAGGLTAIGLRSSVATAVSSLATDAAAKRDPVSLAKDLGAVIDAAKAP